MDNVTINDEGLMEVSPTASRDETLSFIDQYRQLQGENTAQIGSAAHALGSDLEAQYGGLHGPSDYIKSRYQTPQTESRIAGLRTAAQLSALNQLMQNEQAKWANRYNQAYRNYQKRASDAAKAATTGGSGDIVGQAYDEYTGSDTLGVSSDLDRLLPEGANRITVVGANGAYSNGYPSAYVTADNTDGSMGDTVVGQYGVPTVNNNGASDFFDLVGQFNLPENARRVAQFTANPLTAVSSWAGEALRNLFGGN